MGAVQACQSERSGLAGYARRRRGYNEAVGRGEPIGMSLGCVSWGVL